VFRSLPQRTNLWRILCFLTLDHSVRNKFTASNLRKSHRVAFPHLHTYTHPPTHTHTHTHTYIYIYETLFEIWSLCGDVYELPKYTASNGKVLNYVSAGPSGRAV
jgi:hypothetical protein